MTLEEFTQRVEDRLFFLTGPFTPSNVNRIWNDFSLMREEVDFNPCDAMEVLVKEGKMWFDPIVHEWFHSQEEYDWWVQSGNGWKKIRFLEAAASGNYYPYKGE